MDKQISTESLHAALRSVNAVAIERGDKFGVCDQIDNDGQPYQSQWLADLLASHPQAAQPSDAKRQAAQAQQLRYALRSLQHIVDGKHGDPREFAALSIKHITCGQGVEAAQPQEAGQARELPKPDIRIDAFGDILPTDGRKFVMGDFYSAEQMRAALAQAAPAVPDTHVIVPKEPTEAMHVAAVQTIVRCTGNDDFPPRVWHAMLAAAPSPAVKHSLTTEAQAAPEVDARDTARYAYLLTCDYIAAKKYLPDLNEADYKTKLRAKHDAALSAQSVSRAP